jgi:hypothetical protein
MVMPGKRSSGSQPNSEEELAALVDPSVLDNECADSD